MSVSSIPRTLLLPAGYKVKTEGFVEEGDMFYFPHGHQFEDAYLPKARKPIPVSIYLCVITPILGNK